MNSKIDKLKRKLDCLSDMIFNFIPHNFEDICIYNGRIKKQLREEYKIANAEEIKGLNELSDRVHNLFAYYRALSHFDY